MTDKKNTFSPSGNEELVNQNAVVAETKPTKIEKQEAVSGNMNMSQEDLIKVIAAAVSVATQNNYENNKFDEEALALKNTIETNTTLKVGTASAAFVKQMETEIAEGNFYMLHYSKHIAAAKSGRVAFNINGYTVRFTEGIYTKIPNSLKENVELFLEGLDIQKQIPIEGALTGTEGFTPAQQAYINNSSNGMFQK
jgi:hypothetical protein